MKLGQPKMANIIISSRYGNQQLLRYNFMKKRIKKLTAEQIAKRADARTQYKSTSGN
jgi:hypothetical protein